MAKEQTNLVNIIFSYIFSVLAWSPFLAVNLTYKLAWLEQISEFPANFTILTKFQNADNADNADKAESTDYTLH